MLGEFKLAEVLFEGDDEEDQMDRIMRCRGTPSLDVCYQMNPSFDYDTEWKWGDVEYPNNGLANVSLIDRFSGL